MSADSLVERLGPHRAALFAATGSAVVLLLVAALLLAAGSGLYLVVLGIAPVDFALVFLLLRRSFRGA